MKGTKRAHGNLIDTFQSHRGICQSEDSKFM